MTNSVFNSKDKNKTLTEALLEAKKIHGWKKSF